MSDITKKVFSIEGGDSAASAPKTTLDLRPIVEEPVVTFESRADEGSADTSKSNSKAENETIDIDTLVSPLDSEPSLPRFVARPQEPEPETVGHGLTITGLVLGLMTALAIGAWTYGYFELSTPGSPLSPVAYAALICAIFIPAITVFLLFLCLRGLKQSRTEGQRLALIADRLMRVDERVEDDVKRLSSAIRGELSAVDARLAQTHAAIEAFKSDLSAQSREIDQQTLSVTERAETIDRTMTLQRQALESLSETTDNQFASIAEIISTRRSEIDETVKRAGETIETAQARLTTIAEAVESQADHLRSQTENAASALHTSATTLQTVSDQSGQQTDRLRDVYDQHADRIQQINARLSKDQSQLDDAMSKQVERMNAIEAQIEQTDQRLSALLDHANSVQTALATKLADIEATLGKADTNAQAFTRDMTDRVSDSIAETRRDMALMETELRSLQARLSATKPLALDFNEPDASDQDLSSKRSENRSGRIHLKPLDIDFPPLDPPGAAPQPSSALEAPDPIPVRPRKTSDPASQSDTPPGLTAFEDQDLLNIPGSNSDPDLIRRPGQVDESRLSKKKTEKTKSGWHWRDMLGRIDPLDDDEAPLKTSSTPSQRTATPQQSLQPSPQPVRANPIPAAPDLPEGSEIVARLCEAQLAPSAIVDQGTIIEASNALMTGKERVTDVVLRRLNDPVMHLRRVYADDLEFRLLSENFSRHYGETLLQRDNTTDIKAEFGSARGRAFLLCAAALRD